uniref:Putative dermacentor 9 kDa family member n=1 Tax=Rhipicephalus pulchellus TaxID=72859 RepID=L7MC49_RHIPC
MNGMCLAFCSLLALSFLIETTAEDAPASGPGGGISPSVVVGEILEHFDEAKQKYKKASSNSILCHGPQTHLCYQENKENCICVHQVGKCPPDGMTLKCPSGHNQSCYMTINRPSETSCRCIC